MSKMEVLTLERADPADLFTALTAEAWLDPDLAADLIADKPGAIVRFAERYGHAPPSEDAIVEFELPRNPIGEAESSVTRITMNTTTDYGCSTAATGCGSNNGTCGPTPTSLGCPSIPPNCTGGCAYTYNDQCAP